MKEVFRGIPKVRIFTDVILCIIWGVLNAVFSDILSSQITKVLKQDYDFVSFALSFAGFILFWELLELVADVHGTVSSQYIENETRYYYLNKMYYIEPKVLREHNTGYISGLINRTIAQREWLYRRLCLFLPLSITYVSYFAYRLCSIHWILSVTMVIVTVASFIFRFLMNKIIRIWNERLAVEESVRDKLFLDSAININTVQKMTAIDFICNKLKFLFKGLINTTVKWSVLEEIGFCGNKVINFMFAPIAILVFSYYVEDKSLTQEFLSMLVVISIQLVHQTKDINTIIARWAKYQAVLDKLSEIFKEDNERHSLFSGDFHHFSIENLVYQYKVQEGVEPVTVNIPEFSFYKGDKVCIYGESGQGKTTTLNLVSGEIQSEKVRINHNPTKERLDCVYIAQDTEILDMSLADNLTLGKSVSASKIINFLCRVGLGEWFDKQEKGLGTILGERGVFVSTGQRQRLNLIRGLLQDDKEIYLLDEPTSNVDEDTEEVMISLIKSVLATKTVLIVTHKPKIMEICNKVYKFENGVMHLEKDE